MLEKSRADAAAAGRLAPRADRTDPPLYCFCVLAAADPGVMPRVLQQFAKRNLVPTRWHSDVIVAPARDGGLATLQIDIQMEGMEAELAAYVARCLRQIYGVDSVLTSTKTAG